MHFFKVFGRENLFDCHLMRLKIVYTQVFTPQGQPVLQYIGQGLSFLLLRQSKLQVLVDSKGKSFKLENEVGIDVLVQF